jgi:hypothetical protein
MIFLKLYFLLLHLRTKFIYAVSTRNYRDREKYWSLNFDRVTHFHPPLLIKSSFWYAFRLYVYISACVYACIYMFVWVYVWLSASLNPAWLGGLSEFIIPHWCPVKRIISKHRSHPISSKQNVDFLENGCNDSDYISPICEDSVPKQKCIDAPSGIRP